VHQPEAPDFSADIHQNTALTGLGAVRRGFAFGYFLFTLIKQRETLAYLFADVNRF
jgi:hypothetical protein